MNIPVQSSTMKAMPTLLSLGMGVESTAILVRWIKEPATRPCALEDLIVLSAQTGDEYRNTGTDIETHLLPLMREHNIRYVQVARHGHLEADGITVLSDTRQPYRCHIEGDYKLSDELRAAGTIPQFGGEHKCSLKHKVFVLESWINTFVMGALPAAKQVCVRHAFGYNADETKRIDKSIEADAHRMALGFGADEPKRIARATAYDTPRRISFFPLQEWGWSREDCLSYLKQVFGIVWSKSACIYCPFNECSREGIERHKAHPDQLAVGLMLEHVSMSLNPRGQLYKKNSLVNITMSSGNHDALSFFAQKLDATPWALYRVRRIYAAGKTKDGRLSETKKGMAQRAVEKLEVFDGAAAAKNALSRKAHELDVSEEVIGLITYVYIQKRGSTYPAKEEFYVAAPAYVETKARYGISRFDEQWDSSQGCLF